MHLIQKIAQRLKREQDGYTMIAVVAATSLVTLLMGVAMAATNQDLNLVKRDLEDKRALAAAQAGLADYSFHLNNDTGYWTRCTNVPPPHAVNLDGGPQPGATRPVPGANDGTSYRIDLIPATGRSQCSEADPVGSMLEQSGAGIGTFRIRSTGMCCGNSPKARQSVVATYKQASFLDYIYFTQLETSDPVTYGFPNPSAALTGAYSQCTKFRREGRQDASIPNSGGEMCTQIVFVSGDQIDGPLHTNDDLLICGDPSFGRSQADVIEVSAPPVGWSSGCGGGANPDFVGPFVTNAPVLTPPPTNTELRTIAGPSATYTGQTAINLSGNSMTITNNGTTSGPFSIPSAGVVYVENGAACSTSYSPFTATYPSSGCGNALVRGNGYSSQLTIAAENDIIIEDDLIRTGNGLLGLVANNFVRVKHPICPSNNLSCSNGTITSQTVTSCNSGVNGTGTNSNIRIDAAILAIDHSFIVDHYNCGGSLGELEVNGAIAQKFRGPVGTTGGTGYLKDYNYDDRLRYLEPPHFFDPVESAWHVERETLDFANN